MIEDYPFVKKYLGGIIKRRRSLNNPEKSKLLQVVDNNQEDRLECLIQGLEKSITNFADVFKITSQLNNQNDPDGRIDDMIAELRAGSLLVERGYKNIRYQRKTFDFICQRGSKKFGVEVEFLRGPDFKRQKQIAPGLGYELHSEPEIKKLGQKIRKGFSQLPRDFYRVVILVTNNIELDKFWFGENIDDFRKQMGREYKSKIFIVTNGDIYG